MRYILYLLLIVPILWVGQAAAGEPIDAVWKPQQVKFRYIGITTKYTCAGLEGLAGKLVRELGARDVEVDLGPCFGGNDVQSMFNITIDYTALSEASPDDENTVEAIEKEVVIDDDYLGRLNGGNCELIERFVKYALPKTEFKKVSGKVGCNANRSDLAGKLRVQTLTPAAPAR